MWNTISACIQGTSHIKNNIPCQDYVKHKTIEGGVILTLADGAGSAKRSSIGAQISCNTIIDCLSKDFDLYYNLDSYSFQYKIIHKIRTRLGVKAKLLESTKEDFASTLLFVCIHNGKFIAGHIGDGVIGVIKDSCATVLSKPENGEFANSTFFTTSRNYRAHLRLYKGETKGYTNFFLMSDGAADCLYDKSGQTFSKAIYTLDSWMRNFQIDEVNKALEKNMNNLFTKRTADDCSFVMCQSKQS